MKNFLLLLFSFCAFTLNAQSILQKDSVHKKRLNILVIGSAGFYTAGMAGLNHLWYQDFEKQSFRFFNDNAEWKQVDKLGHFYSGFYLSTGMQRALLWAGVPKRKADVYGALTGFMVLAPIEIFDGYSAAYGASTGDLIANGAGAGLFLGQQLLWNETRIYPKYSYHHTRYAALRPNTLGNDFTSRFIKDYNGQTQWLSFDMDKFVKFPQWLNLAVGYGAEEMIYGRDYENIAAGFHPYRQFYFSFDPDLTAIKTRSKTIKTLLFFANMIKLPSPTLEFSRKGAAFKPFYF